MLAKERTELLQKRKDDLFTIKAYEMEQERRRADEARKELMREQSRVEERTMLEDMETLRSITPRVVSLAATINMRAHHLASKANGQDRIAEDSISDEDRYSVSYLRALSALSPESTVAHLSAALSELQSTINTASTSIPVFKKHLAQARRTGTQELMMMLDPQLAVCPACMEQETYEGEFYRLDCGHYCCMTCRDQDCVRTIDITPNPNHATIKYKCMVCRMGTNSKILTERGVMYGVIQHMEFTDSTTPTMSNSEMNNNQARYAVEQVADDGVFG